MSRRRPLPWELGAIARAAGVGLDANPYHRGAEGSLPPAARAWELGWRHEDAEIAAKDHKRTPPAGP